MDEMPDKELRFSHRMKRDSASLAVRWRSTLDSMDAIHDRLADLLERASVRVLETDAVVYAIDQFLKEQAIDRDRRGAGKDARGSKGA
ncbi:hypothetical protein [Planctomyces sp. SH-PL14]|uniref:hypothetical protein n=1 Tax=Planctomyces sp. SH-PL14 TaxID=1632864 RepID=UPI00078B2E68|nr:hypothetical protein [Planctomyces sp. SH-PL14]AMV22416.1 hypothetical protein VT03_31265 [Planctomyces sp. SH-PL14]